MLTQLYKVPLQHCWAGKQKEIKLNLNGMMALISLFR